MSTKVSSFDVDRLLHLSMQCEHLHVEQAPRKWADEYVFAEVFGIFHECAIKIIVAYSGWSSQRFALLTQM